jgi:hypothetical protein
MTAPIERSPILLRGFVERAGLRLQRTKMLVIVWGLPNL